MSVIDTSTWKEFRVVELFEHIERGKVSNAGALMDGDTRYIAASFTNNGLARFVETTDDTLISKGNCIALILNGNGGVGRNTYQADNFAGSTSLRLAYHSQLNQYNGLFLVACLNKSYERYNYSFANARTGKAFQKETVFLPATSTGKPDWEYMESVMREYTEQRSHALDTLITLGGGTTSRIIDTTKWGEFVVGELFESIERATRRTINSYVEGNVPYVTNSACNNGISNYIEPKSENDIEHGQCITVNTVDGSAFWQESNFLANSSGNGLIMLRHKKLNTENALFVCAALSAVLDPTYAVMLTTDTVRNQRVQLPITPTGEPNWDYMEQAMRQRIAQKETTLGTLAAFM